MFRTPIAMRAVNDSTATGGWEQSSIRKWLADKGMATLPDDLRNQIRSVRKLTNNTGGTKDVSSITATDDILWLPSMSELCGYQAPETFAEGSEYLSALYSGEGDQYQLYREQSVSGLTTNEAMIRTVSGKKSATGSAPPAPTAARAPTRRTLTALEKTATCFAGQRPETLRTKRPMSYPAFASNTFPDTRKESRIMRAETPSEVLFDFLKCDLQINNREAARILISDKPMGSKPAPRFRIAEKTFLSRRVVHVVPGTDKIDPEMFADFSQSVQNLAAVVKIGVDSSPAAANARQQVITTRALERMATSLEHWGLDGSILRNIFDRIAVMPGLKQSDRRLLELLALTVCGCLADPNAAASEVKDFAITQLAQTFGTLETVEIVRRGALTARSTSLLQNWDCSDLRKTARPCRRSIR
ncbi:MAG: DUF6273 domain-containing protein [Collinsella sp.]